MRWKDLRDTDFGVLESLAVTWGSYITAMVEQSEVLTEDVSKKYLGVDHYDSATADEVRNHVGLLTESFEDDLHEYAAVKIKATLEDAHAELTAAQAELEELLESIEAGKYKVTGPAHDHDLTPTEELHADIADLTVSSALMKRAGVTESDFATVFGENRAKRRLLEAAEAEAAELAEVLRAIMSRAHVADDRAAETLSSLDEDPAALPPLLAATYDDLLGDYAKESAAREAEFLSKLLGTDPPATPAAINSWWDGLSDEERARLIEDRPNLVGTTDGIPAEARDTANRDLLQTEITGLDIDIERLEQQLAQMEADGTDTVGHGRDETTASAYRALQERLAELEGKRDSLANLQNEISTPFKTEDGPSLDHYLLSYSSKADGRAVVAVGNPDTADNVNVYVPGTGSELSKLDGDLGRAETMASDAYRYAPGSDTASIMWLGYDAPDDVVPDAMDTEYAENAASGLSAFTDGLRATAEDEPSNLTMTGHSYGSTTVGIAARDAGLAADNMIFVGSPGVGVDEAAELGIDPDRVWAGRNDEDIIDLARDENVNATIAAAAVGGPLNPPGAAAAAAAAHLLTPDDQMVHGTDPVSDSFGGNTFHSEATRDGARENHSAYWDKENNVGRKNMAYIITGQTNGVT
ncbi:hypothetical protein GCM10027447_35180 [Glycomyces halotolerans]